MKNQFKPTTEHAVIIIIIKIDFIFSRLNNDLSYIIFQYNITGIMNPTIGFIVDPTRAIAQPTPDIKSAGITVINIKQKVTYIF